MNPRSGATAEEGNTRNDTSGTSSDSDKLCNSLIQVHIQRTRPPQWTKLHSSCKERLKNQLSCCKDGAVLFSETGVHMTSKVVKTAFSGFLGP